MLRECGAGCEEQEHHKGLKPLGNRGTMAQATIERRADGSDLCVPKTLSELMT